MTISAPDPTTFAEQDGAVVLDPSIPSAPGFLGIDGERTLPSTLAEAFGESAVVGERTLREMKREPVIRFGDNIIRSLVCEGNHRIVSPLAEPDAATMKDAVLLARATTAAAYRDFCAGMIGALARDFRGVLFHALDAFGCGHKLFEAEVQVVGGRIVAADLAPKPRTAYRLRVDRSNRLLGAIATGRGGDEMVPASNLFVFSIGGEDDDPRGSRALDSVYDPYYRKNVAKPVELKSLETSAGGLSWVYAMHPDAVQTVRVPTGVLRGGVPEMKEVSVVPELAKQAAIFRSGRRAILPYGWTFGFFEPKGESAFGAFYDRCDREMLMALLIAARALLEAEHGSKADSESAGGFLASLRDFLRGLLCGAVAAQIFAPFLRANFPDYDPELCPRYEITTVEQADNSEGLTAYTGAFLTLNNEQRRALQSALNIPIASDDDLDQIASILLGRRPEAQPVEGEGDEPTKFKGARSPQTSLATELKKRDKSLRALLKRLAEEKVDRTDFDAEVERILTGGHEAALKLGLRASGTKSRKVAEDYLAETLTTQLEFMGALADGVEDGEVSSAMAQSRSRNFVRRMRGTANAAFHEASPAEATFVWELGANEKHCAQCPRLARMTADEPWTKDEVIARPGEGDTDCRMGCRCRLVRTDGAEGFGPIDFDPLGDAGEDDDKE